MTTLIGSYHIKKTHEFQKWTFLGHLKETGTNQSKLTDEKYARILNENGIGNLLHLNDYGIIFLQNSLFSLEILALIFES